MTIVTFPFAGGETDSIDSALLPDGLIRRCENFRLERDGRLALRPAFTNLGLTTYGTGTFVPYDLAVYRERVVALGDRFGFGVGTDLYELQSDNSARDWRPTNPDSERIRIPSLHSPRILAEQVDQEDGVFEFQQAASASYLCVVTRSTAGSYVHVVDVETDQTLLYQELTASLSPKFMLRVSALTNGTFVIVGRTTNSAAVALTSFDPAVDTEVATPLVVVGGAFSIISIAMVADENNVVLCVGRDDDNTVTSLFDAAGTNQQIMGTVAERVVNGVSAPDSAGNCALVFSNTEGRAATLNTGSGSVVAGPTALPDTVGLTLTNAGIFTMVTDVALVSLSTTTAQNVVMQTYEMSTGTFTGVSSTFPDLTMVSVPAEILPTSLGQVVAFGAVGGDGTGGENGEPSTVYYQVRVFNDNNILPLAALDFDLGAPPLEVPPLVVVVGSAVYLPRLAVNEDERPSPSVVRVSSTNERRQWSTVGGALYFAGGTVLRYAGRAITEAGFHERPRIISSSSSIGAGELLASAEYDYRIHWEWIDEIGELARSAVSDIHTLTMGAGDDTVELVCSTPHSLRTSDGGQFIGSSVRLVAERTAATVTETAAELTGSNVVTLPGDSFAGRNLFLKLEDSAGSVNLSHAFGSDPISVQDLVDTLNGDSSATASGRAVYSHSASRIIVATTESGSATSIVVPTSPSSANIVIGWLGSATAIGTTSRTKGTNFHRTRVEYLAVADNPGTRHTLTDTRKDQSDPIDTDTDLIAQGVVYTQSNPTGSDVSPLPCAYLNSGHDRLITAGQAQPSQWSVSKLTVRNQALAFADENLLSFSGEIRGDILAVVQFGETIVLWTEREIWAVSGQGPGQNGQGEFFAARQIPSDGGMKPDGWKSIIETSAGLFFQLDDDKVYMLSRSLKLEWVSHAVRRRLEAYPVVKDVAHTVSSQELVWALANTGGTDGGHIRLDLRTQQWFFDPVGVTDAIVSQQGRLVGITGGVPYRQDLGAGETTAVVGVLETGDFQGFQRLGWGQVTKVSALGTWRGPCQIQVDISNDAGVTYEPLGLHDLTIVDYSVGSEIALQYEPAVQMLKSFRLRVTMTPKAASAGAYLHAFNLETTKSPGSSRNSNQNRAS